MKKLFTVISILILSVGAMSARDRNTTDKSALPDAAQFVLNTYYPSAEISNIKIDSSYLVGNDYDVTLADGTEIDFDSEGNVTEVDAKTGKVPDGLVLAPIRNYVAKNYPKTDIVSVSVDRPSYNYEVELASGVDLEFDRHGKFKRIDR